MCKRLMNVSNEGNRETFLILISFSPTHTKIFLTEGLSERKKEVFLKNLNHRYPSFIAHKAIQIKLGFFYS